MGKEFEAVEVEVLGDPLRGVALLTLNRPDRANALNGALFREIPAAITRLDANLEVRCIVVCSRGKHFCAGIDLTNLSTELGPAAASESENPGVERDSFRRRIKWMQDAFTAFERCSKPVIAAIHGACLGGGVDLITACDLRYCTGDAKFSVKEADLAIAADLGSLQRLPGIVGWSTAMELALTARTFDGEEAQRLKLVHGVCSSREELERKVLGVAAAIDAKPALAVMGTKAVLLKSRECSTADGLDYVATWNAALLWREDVQNALMNETQNRVPSASKL